MRFGGMVAALRGAEPGDGIIAVELSIKRMGKTKSQNQTIKVKIKVITEARARKHSKPVVFWGRGAKKVGVRSLKGGTTKQIY